MNGRMPREWDKLCSYYVMGGRMVRAGGADANGEGVIRQVVIFCKGFGCDRFSLAN